MIIRSMSRKAPTFSQLGSYIGQDDEGGGGRCFSQNLYYHGSDQKTISRLFWDNYAHLPERKNGNALYHELLVLEPQPHLPKDKQAQILLDLARQYSEMRAPFQLVWGRVHFDTAYPHIHLMISANEAGSNRRKRLDKQSFSRIQKELEIYKEVSYPELIEGRIYNKTSRNNIKVKASEGEYVRRTGLPSDKQKLAEQLRTLFTHHTHITALKADLSRAGFTLYQRGINWGVKNTKTGKRYRLKTLGLTDDFARIIESTQNHKQPENNSTPLSPDAREQALINARKQIEHHASQQLIDFERGSDEEHER